MTISGGILTGTGQIEGNLLGAGTVTPAGAVAGPMMVSGTYDDSNGTLTIPVSGTTTRGVDYGQLLVAGAATLGGTIAFATATGFRPPIGTQYTLLNAASVTGKFGTVKGALLADRQYVLSYTPTSVLATVEPLPPTVAAVSPSVGPVAGGATVTISGTNFVAGATVDFGAMAASSVTIVSAKRLTATAPAGTSGSVNVTVTTGGGTSKTSAKDLYANGAPTIASFTPSSGITGSKVTITGSAFAAAVNVSFGTLASPKVTISSGTKLTAAVPNGAALSTISVSDTQGSSTSSTNFTPTLSITSFSPSTGAPGAVVTINGVGFNNSSVVKFNGAVASTITLVSPNELQATVPATATSGTITVTNTTVPTGTVNSPTAFTVT